MDAEESFRSHLIQANLVMKIQENWRSTSRLVSIPSMVENINLVTVEVFLGNCWVRHNWGRAANPGARKDIYVNNTLVLFNLGINSIAKMNIVYAPSDIKWNSNRCKQEGPEVQGPGSLSNWSILGNYPLNFLSFQIDHVWLLRMLRSKRQWVEYV